MKRSPVSTRLRTAITPLLITGAMGTALAVASSTTPAPVTENLCTSGGNVHTFGTNANTMTAALAPTRPVAVQVPMNTCMHPCNALYHKQTEACGEPSGTKDSLCMSKAADRHADCLSVYQ
ncbi:MAG: hypothetical protein J2P17_29635 [Mycobacterium sp.]|nr:hypothetical protein [Mycobacterium sp.]